MRVIVIGGGAGGLMAAGVAAQEGNEVLLLEKNSKVGRKLYITGKGRCNITNACDSRGFMENVVSNPKFLLSAINQFSPSDTLDFCEKWGCPIKIERGQRVFPVSDKALTFIDALFQFNLQNGVKILFDCVVDEIVADNQRVVGVVSNGKTFYADKIILATGGLSYPGTGSTGDGYKLSKKLGHTITPILPALVGLDTVEDVSALAGVSLKNVRADIYLKDKPIAGEFGEMLFTHTGVSGPIILSLSSKINKLNLPLELSIDLKPALTELELDGRILKDFDKYANKEFKNALGDLTISSLLPIIIDRSGISPFKKVNQISKSERLSLVKTFKQLKFSVKKLSPLSTAIVTAGGVSTKEINPKTMESKIINGLYFAGEVIDIDALTGGFNIQIALSTGYLAGKN